jgi:hypothetical protein
LRHYLFIDENRSRELPAAMYDTMTGGNETMIRVSLFQPVEKQSERAFMRDRAVEGTVNERRAVPILRDKMRVIV